MKDKNSNLRVIPTEVNTDYIDNEGNFIYDLQLLDNKDFSYELYGYLQHISYYDKECNKQFRKVYTDDFSIRNASKALRMGTQKVQRHLKYLREIGFVTEEKFEDSYGKYHKLPKLDCSTYTKLDFENKLIKKLFYGCNEYAVRVALLYKAYCDVYQTCYLTIEQICEKIGLSQQGYCYMKIKTINSMLCEMGIIYMYTIKTKDGHLKNVYGCNI